MINPTEPIHAANTAGRMNNTPLLRLSAVTLFPQWFDTFTQDGGVISSAIHRGIIHFECVPLRQFAEDTRCSVDDRPYGGGDGMVLRPDVAQRALQSVLLPNSYVVHVTPKGQVFHHGLAQEWAKKTHLIFLCGRYAGFDERFVEHSAHAHVSLGDFILSGGELPTLAIMDAVCRLVPGVLGNSLSAENDSFCNGLLEAPVYTQPRVWQERPVPDVYFSGDHKKVASYRRREQLRVTALNRPDLLLQLWNELSAQERAFVQRVWKHGKTFPDLP